MTAMSTGRSSTARRSGRNARCFLCAGCIAPYVLRHPFTAIARHRACGTPTVMLGAIRVRGFDRPACLTAIDQPTVESLPMRRAVS